MISILQRGCMVIAGLTLTALVFAPLAHADDAPVTRDDLEKLLRRLNELESRVKQQDAEIERLRGTSPTPAPTQAAPTAPPPSSAAMPAPAPAATPAAAPMPEVTRSSMCCEVVPEVPQCSGPYWRSIHCKPPNMEFCNPCGAHSGYDGKFYIAHPAWQFRMNTGLYTQFRWSYNKRQQAPPGEKETSEGFDFARTRWHLDGDFTKYFYYHFRLNFDETGDVRLINAYLRWKISPCFYIQAGEQFLALSREDWMFPQDLLTTDFSANDGVFAIGTSRGFQAHLNVGRRDRFWAALTDGAFGGGQSSLSTTAADFLVSARWEHQFGSTDWSIWDDLVGRKGRPFGILFGLAGAYQDSGIAQSTREAALVTADLSVNWSGGQAMVYGTWRTAELRAGGTVEDYGYVAQVGQFISNVAQLYARYEAVVPGDGRPSTVKQYDSIVGGVNFYPFRWTNRYKFSLEGGYLFSVMDSTIVPPGTNLGFLSSTEDEQWYVRLQMQFGF